MIHSNEEKHNPNGISPDAHRAKRRQLLKRGALLVPAIVTLHARPAMADAVGTYGADYNSYFIVNGQKQEVISAWSSEQQALQNNVVSDGSTNP